MKSEFNQSWKLSRDWLGEKVDGSRGEKELDRTGPALLHLSQGQLQPHLSAWCYVASAT